MVKRMSLNDDQFRKIMVRDNDAKDGDREDQHKDRLIQDDDQTVDQLMKLVEVWFDKLDKNMCTFRLKVHN